MSIKYNYFLVESKTEFLCLIKVEQGSIQEQITVDFLLDRGLKLQKSNYKEYNFLLNLNQNEIKFDRTDLEIICLTQAEEYEV